ncbi:uncharacterized protein TRIADDRAFT_52840 [Trichoplax adhaerens]|uniref:Uncharacterized protein n=1 Tax=Trichoplax adhaerens TaxID=10228 RepID=B3RKP1_TRIAD|nr:hypothetical protein TRIADDRAFT_52840 [Trichoplax adhaerens]EDV29198.1 hypothetical protein TRIADDRAFT_52840 [Trichoplax adhaerens]|eukprot:XP_002108400.1 hypothetical protein TRIADDRAFT_52840 [Trichoplax adhaerens]
MAGTTEVMDLIQVKLQQFLRFPELKSEILDAMHNLDCKNLTTLIYEHVVISENSIRQKLAILDELLRSLESSSTELQEDDIPNSVLQLSCSVYLQEQGNLKQCRRLEKLLYKLSSINQAKFSAIFSNEINELLRKDLDHLPNRLRTVVYLAEGSKLTRETFALSIDSLITYVAYACNEIILKAKEIQPENITMTAKLTLQLFQHFPEVCMRAVWGTENKGDLHSKFELMIKSVLKIIFQCADAIDTLLMASTALGMLINISQDLKLGCNTVTNLLILSGAIDEPKERQNITVYGLKVGNIFVDTSFLKCISESATNFTTLLLIRGLLNSGNIKLLAVSTTMIKKTKPEDSQLGRVLLLILLRLCKDLSNSNFHYQAVQTFAQWLQNTKEMLLEVKMDDHLPLFVSHSPVTDEILKFIWESINDPIDGVSYHVKNIFSLLLLVHSLECKLRQIPENDEFVRELINKTLMISWQSKGRYALLHCIIKQAGPKVVLNIDKTLPFALSRCLSINSLASISCDIYKTFLNDLQVGLLINPKQYARLNEYYRYQHSQALKILVMHFIRINQFISRFAYAKCHIKSEDIISSWATAWIDPIINGLFDDEDALLRHNMRIYWLPATLSIISNSLHQLLDASELRFNNMNSKCPSARATLRHIHAKVMIYNAAKALDIIHVTELPEELLDSSLQCWDDDIRMDAISLLCFSQKRADGLTDMEIKFLRQYLPLNFNSDNAAFRQRLLASLKVLLERIRDSRLLRKRQLAGSDEFRILNQRIMTNIEVLDWLFNCSIECLNPDSSFQRSITGLKVCSLIFQIIASTWNPDKRKGQPPAAMAELINWAHRQQRLQFLSPRNLGILFHCFQSQHGEMESASKEILYKYVAWPIAIKTATDHEKFLAVLAINTYYLICSPKASDCNHGASLMALIVNRYLTNGFSMQLNENCQGFEILKIDGLSTVNEDASLQAMTVLHKLLDHQLTSAKQFLTFAIKETPIYGIITTIRRCLLECPNFIKSNKKSAVGNVKLASPLSFSIQEWRTALKKIIRLADELINYILFDILSDNDISELETSASFADMGKAINRIILSDTQHKLEDNSSSTAMYDLVISFCWLNLKEIGLLIGAIVDTVPLCTIKFEMDKSAKDSQGFLETEDVEKIGDMFIKLLTKCRHKGVIEGCSIGFVQVCTKLLCSSSSTYQDIPKLWLTQALSVITTDQMSSSFTKKSAGLPLLIQSIVSSEPQNAKKTLLRLSMKTLELVTRRPIGEEYDETTDLPQTHALNVMKVLYRDSSLGGDVLCYAADGVKCAIQGLRNPIWTIRNASMHLYGALVSRLFGQKRVRDEHSNYNNTQAAEFFSRYPSLKPFLLDELKLAFEDGEVRRTAWIHGGVYPALIILSKLQQDEEIDSTK